MNEEQLATLFADADDEQATTIVYEHINDLEIVQYGVINYNIDVAWIREQLGYDNDGIKTAAHMEFDIALGGDDDDEVEPLGDAPDNLEE